MPHCANANRGEGVSDLCTESCSVLDCSMRGKQLKRGKLLVHVHNTMSRAFMEKMHGGG